MKDKIAAFLVGVIVGIFVTLFFLGVGYCVYKAGGRVLRKIEAKAPEKTRTIKSYPNQNKFKVGFESKKDIEMFELKDGLYVEFSDQHVIEGEYSLLVEYPEGASYPGLLWEVYRKDKCLNWQGSSAFCFDVYNDSKAEVKLIVKLKSGPNYPKKTYRRNVILPPRQETNVDIPMYELKRDLDISQISYINFFIDNPRKTIILYFDNIHLEKPGAWHKNFGIGIAWAAESKDYSVGVTNSLDKVFKHRSNLPKAKGAKICSAANEYEGFQIVIYDIKKDLKEVKLEIGDLVNQEDGLKIDKENITWRIVGYVPTKRPYYRVPFVGLWPDPLMPKESFDVARDEIQPIWITVHVPEGTSAGEYVGRINIKPQNSHSKELKLVLNVWDFTLPHTTHLKTAFDFYESYVPKWYTRRREENYQNWQRRVKSVTKKFYLDMIKHRISPIFNFDPLTPQFDEEMELYLKEGLTSFAIGRHGGTFGNNWPLDREKLQSLIPLYRQYAEKLRQKGLLDKTYLYTWDEGEIGNLRVAKVAEMVHRADPELKNMVCYHGFWDPDKNPEWGKDIDIWCFQIASYDKEKREKLEQTGKEIWMYVSGVSQSFPTFVIDFPSMAYRIEPWMCWKYKIKGLLYWCVNYWTVDPWKDAMNYPHQNGNGSLYYPGEDGPVSSIRLEVIRDGLEDYEYLYLLQEAISELKERGLDVIHQDLVKKAERLLEIDNLIVGSFSKYTKDPQSLYNLRQRIAEQIVKIGKILNGEGT